MENMLILCYYGVYDNLNSSAKGSVVKKSIKFPEIEILDAKLLKFASRNGGIEFTVHIESTCVSGIHDCPKCRNCTDEAARWYERTEPLSPNLSELHISRALELKEKGLLSMSCEADWVVLSLTDKGKIALENFIILNRKSFLRFWLPILISIISLILSGVVVVINLL